MLLDLYTLSTGSYILRSNCSGVSPTLGRLSGFLRISVHISIPALGLAMLVVDIGVLTFVLPSAGITT